MKKYIGISLLLLTFFVACDTGKNPSDSFKIKDADEIHKIVIQGEQEIHLSKKQTGWTLNKKYTVNPQAVENLIRLLTSTEIKGRLPKEDMDSAKYRMNQKPVYLTLYNQNNELLLDWKIGYFDKNYNATAISLKNDSAIHLVYLPGLRNNLMPIISDRLMYWMTPYIFNYEYYEIAKVELLHKEPAYASFKLEIKKDTAFLQDFFNEKKYPADLRKVGRYLSYFKMVEYDSITNCSEIPQTAPEHVLKITDTQNKTKVLKTFPKINRQNGEPDKHRVYGTINDSSCVLIKRYELDLILKKKSYFKKK